MVNGSTGNVLKINQVVLYQSVSCPSRYFAPLGTGPAGLYQRTLPLLGE